MLFLALLQPLAFFFFLTGAVLRQLPKKKSGLAPLHHAAHAQGPIATTNGRLPVLFLWTPTDKKKATQAFFLLNKGFFCRTAIMRSAAGMWRWLSGPPSRLLTEASHGSLFLSIRLSFLGSWCRQRNRPIGSNRRFGRRSM
ncbi:hypothetical protein TW95_gp1771 [Pandoravirus inopinatum]|uniref:Uncharacterized protein n=1 Tax=Pandoravirus inopinatum TaxID=1605721 RepID=A0A0B5J953_9VIRU|nr:hypothetical protein TW95_gp1771 [Pandoravirus inopinatum]AJF98505.1 hypothetical protein [Pandoravirus inopinatum]